MFSAAPDAAAPARPASFSLLSAQGGLVTDVFARNGVDTAAVLSFDPTLSTTIQLGQTTLTLPSQSPLSRLNR